MHSERQNVQRSNRSPDQDSAGELFIFAAEEQHGTISYEATDAKRTNDCTESGEKGS